MSKRVASEMEVETFLDTVRCLAEDGEGVSVNDKPWHGKRNKTKEFMAETGLKLKDLREFVKELTVNDYSYTDLDRNSNFENEEVWIFGKSKSIVDTQEDLYIKLKVKEWDDKMLVIMSFHREEPPSLNEKLKFPYKE